MPAATTNNNHHPSSSSPAAAMPVVMDGSEDATLLSRSELTLPEVRRRRAQRFKQLARIYRSHYWDLMEDLKVKYREYYWEYGKSPFQEDHEENNQNSNDLNFRDCVGENDGRCVVHGCKSMAMALTRFCHMHILSDTKQKLYKACNFCIKNSQTGPILCGKPTLRSTIPSYCSLHFQKTEKHLNRTIKKAAGLNLSSTSKFAPKFDVLVSEFVKQIQTKRRVAKNAAIESVENEINEDDDISI